MKTLLLLTVPALLSGQAGIFSKIPRFPGDSEVRTNQRYQSQYVFLGSRADEIVVSYPVPFDQVNAPRRTSVIHLRNTLDPLVTCSVEATADGRFRYQYRIATTARSRDPLGAWTLFINSVANLDVEDDEPWSSQTGDDIRESDLVRSRSTRNDPPPALLVNPSGLLLPGSSWRAFSFPQGTTMPGAPFLQLEIVSARKPGIMSMAFWPRTIDLSSLGEIPSDVSGQLAPALAHSGKVMRTVIGPKFGVDEDLRDIALDFEAQLSSTSSKPEVSPKLRSWLRAVNASGLSGEKDQESFPLVIPPLKLEPAVPDSFAAATAKAIRLSLRVPEH